ncbi:MAG: HPP family protein [Sulfurimonas sp.]|uniref:HPP family protein n=1 Tax=Sulfurimonas sp. TaxID=2022749 RepID=UPI0028CD340A|nr:HPP family protein [Sulfurimonas sp.]MDT8339792.1 HPP family protein [Sulfurimonas sp.]
MKKYFARMRSKERRPVRKPISKILWSTLGAFVSIYLLSLFSQYFSPQDGFFLLGSFGASAVLVYGAPDAAFSQPRNLLGGHILSALLSVFLVKFFGDSLEIELLCALSVSLSVLIMHFTLTMHPPGGATALIYIIGSEEIRSIGWFYPITPIAAGALIMLLIALIINNLSSNSKRHYPLYWY